MASRSMFAFVLASFLLSLMARAQQYYDNDSCFLYWEEGPNCNEWRVNTPICRDPSCLEEGTIELKYFDPATDAIMYTLLWDGGEEEEISSSKELEEYSVNYYIHQCENISCQNGGSCSHRANHNQNYNNNNGNDEGIKAEDFFCECPEYASGEKCEEIPECELECQNGGECNFRGYYGNSCFCPINFWGELCEFECTLDCQNGGQCFTSEMGTNITTEQKCHCGFSYEGDLCENERQCDLNCENGGSCMFPREAQWGGDVRQSPFEQGERPFAYCECSQEWVGDICTEPCPCQNGGSCSLVGWIRNRKLQEVENEEDEFWDDDYLNDRYYCNCPDGYSGSDCQFERFNGECTLECQNGGYCSTRDYDSGQYEFIQSCTCQEGYSGGYCELKADGCTFICQNGGICTSGEVSVQGGHDRVLDDESDVLDDYCGCKEGFFGEFCERKECGSGFCTNGASCILLPSGQTAPGGGDYVCDCFASSFNDIYAAGRHCESTAKDICDFGEENPNEPWICTNSGRCILTTSGTECSCTDGHEGPRCEYSASTEEDLEWGDCGLLCENGGKCLKGAVKPLADIFFPFLQATKSSELFSYAPTDDFEYCYCPPGFFGVQCEKQYELCDGGEHICFHGSTCQNGTGDQWECDCSEALAAGLYCQYEATDICDDQDVTKFCTNDGTCSSATDTICDCPEGWDGTRCETEIRISNTAGDTDDKWSGATFHESFASYCSMFLVAAALLFL